jgi:hypothetical protein
VNFRQRVLHLFHGIALPLRQRRPLRFLRERGADALAHSDTTLTLHLRRVHLLLKAWGAGTDVAAAALLHSIYGTEFLRDAVTAASERVYVRELIGERAEALVWLWHSLQRESLTACADHAQDPYVVSRLTGERLPLTRTQFAGLANLMIADAVEQLPRRDAAARARQRGLLTPLFPFALPAAVDAARAVLDPPAASHGAA